MSVHPTIDILVTGGRDATARVYPRCTIVQYIILAVLTTVNAYFFVVRSMGLFGISKSLFISNTPLLLLSTCGFINCPFSSRFTVLNIH